MDEVEMLRRYAARSAESPPPIDVTADVLDTLRRSPRRADRYASSLRPLMSIAAATWLLAFGVAFFASQAWADMQDPLDSLVTPFMVQLQ